MNVATWRIGRLALVVACIGLVALSTTQRAAAADSSPTSSAAGQAQWCESLGGTPTVIENRTVAEGVISTFVECSGGLNGNWHCINSRGAVNCSSGRETWDQVLEDLVEAPPLAPVAGSPAAADASPSVAAADDDQKHDTNTSKDKKSKKGKKGKGRKK